MLITSTAIDTAYRRGYEARVKEEAAVRTEWTPEEIAAEARRLRRNGGNPHNAHADLQTALAMIEGLADLVRPRDERDAQANPPPQWPGE